MATMLGIMLHGLATSSSPCPDVGGVDGCFGCTTDDDCRMQCHCCTDDVTLSECARSAVEGSSTADAGQRVSECDLSLGCEQLVNRAGYLTCNDG